MFFNELDINQILDLGLSIGSKVINYTYENGALNLEVAYTDDVHNL